MKIKTNKIPVTYVLLYHLELTDVAACVEINQPDPLKSSGHYMYHLSEK
jgi:hypothetical protein